MNRVFKNNLDNGRNYLYKKFKLPIKLKVTYDKGKGTPVIFLHGIASDSTTWRNVLPIMDALPVRAIAVDLLGFGASPSPDWLEYNLQDHTKSVAYTIKKLRLKTSPIIVGHSMGGLIAVELATYYPKLVKQLILCSTPLYAEGDFDESVAAYKKTGKKLNNAYFSLYKKIIEKKDFTIAGMKKFSEISKESEILLNDDNWTPFKMSLQNSIIKQNTIDQIEKLNIDTNIIYGRFDVLLMSKYYTALVALKPNIKLTSVSAGHSINQKYANALVAIIAGEIRK